MGTRSEADTSPEAEAGVPAPTSADADMGTDGDAETHPETADVETLTPDDGRFADGGKQGAESEQVEAPLEGEGTSSPALAPAAAMAAAGADTPGADASDADASQVDAPGADTAPAAAATAGGAETAATAVAELPPPHPGDWSPVPLARRGGSPIERLWPLWQRRRGRLLLVVAGLALAVVLLVAAVLMAPGEATEVTYRGNPIDQPAEVLTASESTMRDIVDDRGGALDDRSRCYFSLPDDGTSDVNDYLRCGPVLFVDGDPDQPYLTFSLRVEGDPAAGTAVRLVAGDQPESLDPTSLDEGERLRRPDGQSPPDVAGDLEPPAPPPAEPGLVVANPLEEVDLDEPDTSGQIVSWSQTYRLAGLGELERFGRDDEARRPAEGERFIAVQLDIAAGEGSADPAAPPQVTIQIGDHEPAPVPAEVVTPGDSSGLIVSAPEDAERVDLVVTELGVEQRLSLLSGAPGDDNVAVLQRQVRSQQLDARADLTFAASAPGRVSDRFTVSVSVPSIRLYWFFGADGREHPEDPNRAYLVPEVSFAWDPRLGLGPDVSLDPAIFTLVLPDGTVLPAINLADQDQVLVVFDVPADFTAGILMVGGRYTDSDGVSIDFGNVPMRTEIEIPAD